MDQKLFKESLREIVVEGEFSSWSSVSSGVPQGSVLGPLLFVIFINDMPKNLLNDCSLFADDAKIYGTSAESLQSDLIALNEWSVKWQLPFNGDKCKCLYVGNKRNKPSYVMNGKSIAETKEEKDLGILMDDNFKFRKHCASVIKK